MNIDKILNAAKNPALIPGIYNYCDRWCERCPLTGRCMTFAMGNERGSDEDSLDVHNEAFWETITRSFQSTINLIEEIARREGIDLNERPSQIHVDEEMPKMDYIEKHECTRSSEAYIIMTDHWLASAKGLIKEKEKELNAKNHPGSTKSNPVFEFAGIKDSMEIIQWYKYQICVKIKQALNDYKRDKTSKFSSDSDGSAKVSLIGIDRSIAAWGMMNKFFPEKEGKTLDILVHLEQLRRRMETVFPKARAFVRPGFDIIDPSVKEIIFDTSAPTGA